MDDCRCRTVGELLDSIAGLIERGELDTARTQARECAESYAHIPLPDLDEDGVVVAEPVHQVSWWHEIVSVLFRRAPRTLCGQSLAGTGRDGWTRPCPDCQRRPARPAADSLVRR